MINSATPSTLSRRTSLAICLLAAGLLASAPASAQVPAPASPQGGRAATTPLPPAAPTTPAPPTAVPTPAPPSQAATLSVNAVLGGQAGLIRNGIVWRLYKDTGDDTQLLQTSTQAAPVFPLEPGVYVIHASFGLASATKRIVMGPTPLNESVVINAGALVLGGVVGDAPIPSDKLKFSVYVPIGNDPEARLVVSDVHGGLVIRLPEGNYRVVSTYGDTNAISNADLKVEAGRVTEATLRHRAATITLKLVSAPGTEALANTSFSVLTPGGDTIREAIGAFPSMTLAEGDYIVIARNAGKVYTQEFQVKSGFDRDIEVLVKP